MPLSSGWSLTGSPRNNTAIPPKPITPHLLIQIDMNGTMAPVGWSNTDFHHHRLARRRKLHHTPGHRCFPCLFSSFYLNAIHFLLRKIPWINSGGLPDHSTFRLFSTSVQAARKTNPIFRPYNGGRILSLSSPELGWAPKPTVRLARDSGPRAGGWS